MNGRVAKRLRRNAEKMTSGRPRVKYKPGRQRELDSGCTRSWYHTLKVLWLARAAWK